ncbi:unnamed protein product [Symbiodinium pilosum]|uniref:PAS domain-containing protein n=1 Tax=Symbiodinium pilosum TaxID=2952 RepID=A0A812KCZ2_SYMPI|nr:unnamed protein product [Symbiodinium pilosum]
MELGDFGTLCIFFLQGVTAAALGASILKSAWTRQVPEALTKLQYSLCCLRDRLIQPSKPKPGTACIEAKFVDTLCGLLLNGCRVVVVALFLRLLAIQGPLMNGVEHQLQPSLDITNIISYPIVLFIVMFHDKVISTRTLDLWYILLQGLCVVPIAWTAPEDVTSVSLITQVEFQLKSDAFLAQSAELVLLCSAVYPLRHALYENVRMGLELNTRTIELSAVSELLLGFCDAVVEIDSNLHLTDDSRQFSTLLLHGHGMSAGSLAGFDFLSFFHQEDREHIRASLCPDRKDTQPMALNARMLDCLGSYVRVEILHTSFKNADGQDCRLVGMREFQDFGSVAAPLAQGPSLSDGHSPVEEACVVFDATSFDILSLSPAFQKFCVENGSEDISEIVSIFDLSTGTSANSLAGHIQNAVNEPEKLEGSLPASLLKLGSQTALWLEGKPKLEELAQFPSASQW